MPRTANTPSQALVDRRTILIAAAALATPLAVPNTAAPGNSTQPSNKSSEHQQTDHIRQFYAACRF